jgi:hypothetical protein
LVGRSGTDKDILPGFIFKKPVIPFNLPGVKGDKIRNYVKVRILDFFRRRRFVVNVTVNLRDLAP